MNRHRAAKALVIIALIALTCVALTLARPLTLPGVSPSSVSSSSSPIYSDRDIIFLPGVCPDKTTTKLLAQIPVISTWVKDYLLCKPLDDTGQVKATDRAVDTFAPLLGQLRRVTDFTWKPLYFSYSSNSASYTATDSQQQLSRSVQLLQALITTKICADPHLTFDLVGHSLGGEVAAEWAVTEATRTLICPNGTSIGPLSHVHSLVAFDSPFQGVKGLAYPLDHAETWVAQALGEQLGASNPWIGLAAGALIQYYAAALVSPVDADITVAAALINDPERGVLSRLNHHVLSIGNRADIFVDIDATWVGTGQQEDSDNNPLINDCISGPPDPVCHSNVLFNSAALHWAVDMLVHRTLPTEQTEGL
jgi:pimeloyl-ACP methyl ester carboxylesterase